MNIDAIQICADDDSEAGFAVLVELTLKKDNPNDPYVIKDATGLDLDSIVQTYDDGPNFFRTRPKERVFSLSVRLRPDYDGALTIGDLRDVLYRAIAYNSRILDPTKESLLRFRFLYTGLEKAHLYGRMTKVEANLFTNDPDIKITVLCEYPFLRNYFPHHMAIDNSPASNPHVVGVDTYDIGCTITTDDRGSTAPHGFYMDVLFNSETGFIIWDSRNYDKYRFGINYIFAADDILHFCSEMDNRFLILERAGDPDLNLTNSIYPDAIWPLVMPGDNHFELTTYSSLIDAWYYESFWGV